MALKYGYPKNTGLRAAASCKVGKEYGNLFVYLPEITGT